MTQQAAHTATQKKSPSLYENHILDFQRFDTTILGINF